MRRDVGEKPMLLDPLEWVIATRALSPAARGLLIDVLAHSWRAGQLPRDPSSLAEMCQVSPRRFRRLWGEEIEPVWDRLWLSVTRPRSRRIPDGIRLAVLERDEYTCRDCGAADDLSLDHVYPFSLGGPHTEENLRVLCRSCNSRKGVRTLVGGE